MIWHHHILDVTGDLEAKKIRAGFGDGLKQAGDKSDKVVGLCADLTESTNMHVFAEAHPDRFFEIGIAEQNLATVASGLASQGLVPFAASYAAFSPGRNWEQIRTTACLNNQPVKIVGAHAGISVGPDGATHQALEDLAIMRTLPNMVVIAPADYEEARKATLAMAGDSRPNYIRLAREAVPAFTTDKTPFEIGKALVLTPGSDVTIIATGTMTYHALKAAASMFNDGIDVEVIHCPTIKPLDAVTILSSVQKTGCVVTAEEHQITGGLGGAVAELLIEHLPVPMRRIGVKDRFGESGTPDELMEHFGLTSKHIQLAVHDVLKATQKV
ncbi:transketolase family protein [Candidatus Nomurabacteria bacterium]|nr:transketolase family protein [Candidatus Nomurabacteria bacterium]